MRPALCQRSWRTACTRLRWCARQDRGPYCDHKGPPVSAGLLASSVVYLCKLHAHAFSADDGFGCNMLHKMQKCVALLAGDEPHPSLYSRESYLSRLDSIVQGCPEHPTAGDSSVSRSASHRYLGSLNAKDCGEGDASHAVDRYKLCFGSFIAWVKIHQVRLGVCLRWSWAASAPTMHPHEGLADLTDNQSIHWKEGSSYALR